MRRTVMGFGLLCAVVTGVGCGDDDGGVADTGTTSGDSGLPMGSLDSGSGDGGLANAPTYAFESRFNGGESSVDHSGQTTRNVLITDLKAEMERLAVGVRSGAIAPTAVDEPGEVLARLNGLYRDSAAGLGARVLPSIVSDPSTTCQMTYADLSDSNLIDKMAGEDDVTDHADWDGDDVGSGGPAFAGWTDASGLSLPVAGTVSTPVGLFDALLETFEVQVRACALNATDCPEDPDGAALPLYVTPEGLDLVQLVQKTLLSAINFSQGTDDYLDDDPEDLGKGLLSDNVDPREAGSPDTSLEHAWDEALGYFGAAIDYSSYTDDEIRAAGGRPEYANGYHDADGNACIDVFSEFNFAASVNAAKRDAGSTTMTDFTARAFDAFLTGRFIIADAGGALSASDLDQLRDQRDIVVAAWEEAIVATVIHYVNDVRGDMEACGTVDYDFVDHAKHWSELKGFALAFQFNPRSPFNTPSLDFDALHTQIGDAPVLCDGDTAGYATVLLTVRNTLRDVYGFDSADTEGW